MATQYFPDKKHSKPTGVPVRRRRFIIFTTLLVALLFFFFVPWEVPASVKDAGFSTLSRANVAQLLKSKKADVGEIYGLLHLVTGDHEQEHVLSNAVELDPTVAIDLDVYAAGESTLDWLKEKALIDKNYPVVVFSKTYCPFSKRAKELLATYDIQPPPKIIEVDMRDDGNVIKLLLSRLTNHATFPNILLRGKSIGGSDDLQELHAKQSLPKLIEQAGAKSNGGPGK